jgi:hypothetical protein
VPVYATAADLTAWLSAGTVVPEPDRLLARASTKVEALLLTAVYDVDSGGAPTDPDVAQALNDATCAQVEWWLLTGDEAGAGSQYQSVSIGKISLSRGYSAAGSATGQSQTVAPRAVELLQLAGLISQSPTSC